MKLKKLFYLVKTAVVTFLLVVFLASSGVAQFSIDNTPLIFDNLLINPQRTTDTLKSPVVLDGRELFFVSESRDVSAKDRVSQIKSELQLAIESAQKPQINIEQRNQLPVLYLNERYLHTVTNQDKLDAETLQERAERLKNIL